MNWIGLEGREDSLPAETPDPEQVAGDRAELVKAEAMLKALPEGLRTPLLLSAMDGMSLTEIGAAMGISAKAAEVRVYRARKRLKELFFRDG